MCTECVRIGEAELPAIALAVPLDDLHDGLHDFPCPRLVFKELKPKLHGIGARGGGAPRAEAMPGRQTAVVAN